MNELLDLMRQVENPGTFSIGGKLSSTPPALKVKGVGLISLPFIEQQAKALIKHSEQAPFGRGEETVVDTNVRNVWQIAAEDVEINNPKWIKKLNKSIEKMGKTLGLGDSTIHAELYKLLVYEKDSFFTPHRDTEKIPNMFATLVISLPSEHEGGELIVSHAGESKTYSFADGDYIHPNFATFYADCYHEVRPVTAGYRVCLIYNLSIANRKKQPQLLQQDNIIKEVGHSIQQWKQQTEQPFLSYLLEHSYSTKNLRLTNLKNSDFAKASVLLKAAEKNDCEAYLCLITYYRTSYGYTSHYDHHSYYDDDLDESDFEEEDVDTEETYAHSLLNADGKKKRIDKLYLEEKDILADIPLHDGPGRGVSISEATGNEGATKELWYHRGGIVMWPKEHAFALVKKMDIDYAVNFFKKSITKNKLSNKEYRKQVIDLATHIIPKNTGYNAVDISQKLITLGDIDVLKILVQQKMSNRSYRANFIDHALLAQISDTFGWQHFATIIDDELTNRHYKMDSLEWLNKWLFLRKTPSAEEQTMMKKWLHAFWQEVLTSPIRQENLIHVLKFVALLKIDDVIDDILKHLAKQQQTLFLIDTYGPAVITTLKALKGRDYDHHMMQQCAAYICHEIETDYPVAPQKPQDWSRKELLACNCNFCRKVNAFLPNPDQETMTINKTLKRNIVHLQSMAQTSNVEVNIDLFRIPPKFDGRITKTQRKYEAKKKLFEQAQKLARDLKKSIK